MVWSTKATDRVCYFFGIAFICLVVILVVPISDPSTRSNVSTAPTKVFEPEIESTPTVELEKAKLTSLLAQFADLTDLQQKEWNNAHGGYYRVYDVCLVSEVDETDFFSESRRYHSR